MVKSIVLWWQRIQRFRPKTQHHPAWSAVPSGHCPICKALPDQACDAALHS